ncbi:hypothetical protein [Methylobacterium aerolatum]|uniref:Uncharacterized protein n=1 Tax=Methylobacterium aerolatum TaxID=418708 RepID=A0ABU0HVS0_9HYPH|nr:hypothetical protein [Methylobacterium aerolatum]MDQ0445589.1 hypothetical protein [Methylobacterium aerolatum]GJD36300.1 hypothetical protein FMGBMHLM_3219 [Methylobacterium aerolatum]
MRIDAAALTLALVLAGATIPTARAETVTKERFGCHTMAVTERLFQLVQAGDESGFGQLLNSSLSNGECKYWKKGEDVAVEGRTAGYSCIAGTATKEACFWTPISALDAAP